MVWQDRLSGHRGGRCAHLTSEREPERVKPTEAYLNVLRRALEEECGMKKKDAERYLRQLK